MGKLLGRGLFSIVEQENKYAVKIIETDFCKPPHSPEAEVAALRALDHPNVVALLDLEQTKGVEPELRLKFPLYEATLAQYLRAHSKAAWPSGWRCTLEPAKVAQIGAQVAGALDTVHSLGIIHRDIKPENILMDGDTPVLCDFGISWVPGHGEQPKVCDVATAEYKAPELLLGQDYGAPIDIWALGIVLALLLSRDCTPLFGEYQGDIVLLAAHLCVLGPPPSEWDVHFEANEDLSSRLDSLRGLQSLIKSVLQWRPEQRPSAAELAKMLASPSV